LDSVIFLPSSVIAFAVTAIFMFALQPIAKKVGLVDRPGGRKLHIGDVPIIGGIAMFIGVFTGLVIIWGPSDVLVSVFVASLLLVVIGVIDDRLSLPAVVRLATQVAVVLVMVYGAGLSLGEIGDPFGTGLIATGPAALVFTTVVTLTVINAYNLIDGADGLAGSLALIALLSVAAVSGYASLSAAIALTISAGIVGFLLFNFPTVLNRPVRSFMGDAGSTMLGFTIVWVTIGISQGPDRMISPVHCLWFASIPVYDSLTCFVRRILRGKSPFLPGRDHFHHILQRGGFGVRRTLGILTGMQATYAVMGLIGHFAGVPDVAMFTVWSVLGLSQRRFIVEAMP
jgi:UDP-GlcNAc:undecaprenyl-phosphate GlcNAc-1-phosphate transferase